MAIGCGMTFTFELGWWVAPLTTTIIAFVSAGVMCRDEGSHGDYAAIGNAMVALVVYGAPPSFPCWRGLSGLF
jgi:hypothetical protein